MKQRILVAEDEPKIADLLCKYLSLEGYDSYQAKTGIEALAAFHEVKPDLLILDLMLPEMDGLTVCHKIRASSQVPIIMVTARVDEIDRLLGFSEGADDYVCKPFNPKELMARIKAILRRSGVAPSGEVLRFEHLQLIINEHILKIENDEVPVTQIEFNLLRTFMSNPHQVFTREDLLVSSHGKYSDNYERTIDFHIKNLRKKINLDGSHKLIKTIYGVGYKLC